MSLDKRIETKFRPMFGCHSDLNKDEFECTFGTRSTEKACEGCTRRDETKGTGKGEQ